ncbi:MAG: Beta-lactamase class C-like and penicillin binding proteins (PBPs) superfamily [uncultured Gemmatimonadetes bacterium]|uniref:Beta-lactamase class C-like and penicillin binding proteins (PBPs) superfamily n=1 Tax=uncultured Gemmatimonadota bacterium TaxID=203437 RepID=A0A6J4KG61_9BACT|nr:MAG: Beta-lactamase class C-like and penicillin binding proteins (PBPs) superfamily [uncultured Gemmatimonadota bacterium]
MFCSPVRRCPLWPVAALLCALPAIPSAAHSQGVGTAARSAMFPPDSAVLSLLKQRVADRRSAGVVVGLLAPDGSTRILAWGDPGPGQPPLNEASVFEIGSVTKVFTAALLSDMVQRGEVALDDPVQKYLPAGVAMPTRGGKQITLAMLSDQTSGLPRLPANLRPADASNPYADYTVQRLYEFLSGYRLPRDPGARYEYSNLGVGLLGHVLALRAGKSYEDLVRERIWNPLGMSSTAITLTSPLRARLALGHGPGGAVVPNWDLPTLAGAGAIRSTAVDMLKFLAAQLHPERGPLEKAMALTHLERASAGGAEMGIGLGWHLRHREGDDVVWHNGGTGGYRSFAGFRPATGAAVVVLTNSGGAGADDIGFHLLNPAFPLTPAPAPRKEYTAIPLAAQVLEHYVGTYELAPQFRIVVTREGDALFAQATGQGKHRIWPYAETEFFLREVDAQIGFVRDTQGKVVRLVLHQGGRDMPGRKVSPE